MSTQPTRSRPLKSSFTIGLWLCLTLLALPARGERDGRRRFTKAIDTLTTLLEGKEAAEAIVDKLATPDVNGRIYLFHLEALLKLYQARSPELLEPFHGQIKAFEDAMGHYVDSVEHLKLVEQKALGADAALIAQVRSDQQAARAAMVEFLKEGKWRSPSKSPLLELRRAIAKVDWPKDGEDDEAYLRARLDAQLKKIQKQRPDLDNLDEVHELRRQIRWFLLMIQALDGEVLLSDKDVPVNRHGLPKKQYRIFLQGEPARSRYVQEVEKLEPETSWYLPKWAFVEMTQMVADLGTAKETAEARERWLPKAIMDAHRDPDTGAYLMKWKDAAALAERLIRKSSSQAELRPTAKAVTKTLKRSDLLPTLRDTTRGRRRPACPWEPLGSGE